MRSAVIVIGGSPPDPAVLGELPPDALVVAADSGYDHAVAVGLVVDVLVGDLDSISASGLAAADASATIVERHPTTKDATDTELALDAALARGADHLVVVAGGGDRLDHGLATLFAVSAPSLASVIVDVWWGSTFVEVRRPGDERPIRTGRGRLFSVLPVHGPADGVDIVGAEYPLADHHLAAGTSLGISNVAGPGPTYVRVRTGTVLVIHPDALGGPR